MKAKSTPPASAPAQVRCVIYTRTSSDENLGQTFNSLHAQREAGEALVKARAGEGWVCDPALYDDGGFTGGNMNRPAMQRVLGLVRTRKVDRIVIYKLDRISRSLKDFALLIEELDQFGVAICCVTQSIDTGSSTGRLMVNVLLSFAQYERELVADRTRDKLRATRRRGLWAGGMPLLGYDLVDSKLVVNITEAQRVRAIFALYLELGSLLPVVRELHRRGWVGKSWTTRKGHHRGGQPFSRTSLHRLLTNPTYRGLVRYKDETHPGQHEGIVDTSVWEQVRTQLNANGVKSIRTQRHGDALLKGRIFCRTCQCSMVPAVSKKGTRAYRYYTCGRAQRCGWDQCPTKSVPAGAVEQFVVERLRLLADDQQLLCDTVAEALRQDDEHRADLQRERAAAATDLDRLRAEVRQLVAGGSAPAAIADQLAGLQGRLASTERLVQDRADQLAELDEQPLDELTLARAFREFTGVWANLTTAERSELIDLLIQRIEFDGGNKRIAITFHPAGLRAFNDQLPTTNGVHP